MKIKLPNGEKAEIITKVNDDLCKYQCKEIPTGIYDGYTLYINLLEGLLYALKNE